MRHGPTDTLPPELAEMGGSPSGDTAGLGEMADPLP